MCDVLGLGVRGLLSASVCVWGERIRNATLVDQSLSTDKIFRNTSGPFPQHKNRLHYGDKACVLSASWTFICSLQSLPEMHVQLILFSAYVLFLYSRTVCWEPQTSGSWMSLLLLCDYNCRGGTLSLLPGAGNNSVARRQATLRVWLSPEGALRALMKSLVMDAWLHIPVALGQEERHHAPYPLFLPLCSLWCKWNMKPGWADVYHTAICGRNDCGFYTLPRFFPWISHVRWQKCWDHYCAAK